MPLAELVKFKTVDVDTGDDTELVRRFKDGDESAFAALVRRYQSRLVQAATILLRNEHDAMDVAQDTFVKAYFKISSFKGKSSLYTWLYRIMYNQCISFLRKKKIVSFLSFDSDDDNIDIPSEEPFPDEQYARGEIMTAVTKALGKIPLRQRTVFTMKQLDGLKFAEIARVLGITEGAVKSSYFHAVKKLQGMLKHYGEDYGLR